MPIMFAFLIAADLGEKKYELKRKHFWRTNYCLLRLFFRRLQRILNPPLT